MTSPRRVLRSLLLVCLATFPLVGQAAITDLRVLFDADKNAATGCVVGGMTGVDQVLVTQVTDDGTTANVTQTYRQLCAGGVLGGPVDVNTSGWPVGFQIPSGHMFVETVVPFTAFGSSAMPSPMRIGFSGTRGGDSFTALAHPNGDPLMFPTPPAGRRHAVAHPGPDRVIILDGLDPDWNGISPLAQGTAGGGASAIKLIATHAYASSNDHALYFNFDLNLSGGIQAVNDSYVRTQGEPTFSEPAPGVLGNDISNGVPLTAVPVDTPDHGDVTLNPDGSFTYTPNDPDSLETDTFDYKATHGTDESNVATVSIFVEQILQAPAFTSANSVQLQAGVAANFTVTTIGTPPPAITRSGTLPAGVTFTDNGDGTATIGGTPTIGSGGSYALVFTATNAAGTVNQNFTIVVCDTITVTNPATSTGTAGVAFSQTFTQTGAVGTATFTIFSGVLPAGLTLATNGTLSGTPTVTGSFPIRVRVTDSNGCTGTGPIYNLVIGCQAITVTNPATNTGTAGTAFSQTFTQTGAIGGATFTTASTLPAGLTLAANGTLAGTPTQTGSFPIVVTVTDGNGCTGSGTTYNLTINCQVITVNNPATNTGTAGAAFSQTFTQTGAIGGATFTTASTLPAGLTLATNGTLSGTPTQTGSFPIVVTVTDGNGCTGTGATYTLVIGCQTITVTNPAVTTATVGTAFSQTFTQTNAIGAVTFTTASTLPTGFTLAANGTLSGTTNQFGTFPIVVTVTDANGCTGTGATYNLVVNCQTITVTNPGVSSGVAGTPFSQTFTQTGAIGGATFTTASTLPAGLTLATSGTLSGTPTQTGSFPIVVTVTDGNGCTGTSATYTLVIACQTINVTNPANTNGTASSAFSETFTQTGAIGGATFTTASTLPAGLSLATNGVLSGTPTQTGSFPIVVTVTDGNGCTGTSATYTLIIGCQTITVTNPANTNGTASSAFSETFTQTGAIGTATFTTGSTLPAGLSLATNGVLSGTPTQTGSFPIVVVVTDANGCTGTSATYMLVIGCQTITVTNPATTTGTVSAAFSQTFTQTGAIGTATFTTASTLPAGLTLATNGTLSGTPTQSGSFPIVVTVTDSNGCTGTSATYTLVIGCQTITVTNPANLNGTVSSAFSETFTQTSAVGGATFTIGSGTLPAGLTLATNGVLSGVPTQSGSFPITVTVTDGNGCTGTGPTYNLVIACQVITVTNPVNATGPAGSPFSETFTQTGAIGAATFTTASTLPTGLTLSTAGVLSGTPTQGGTFPIVVTVTDSNGCTGVGPTYNLIITCPVITVTNPANANGTASSAFSETFTQTGGIGAATFTLASGTLPAGLTLATNGVLSGIPTQTGSFPITVTATDSNGCTGTGATYTLVIGCQVITVNNPANANGTASSAFSETFTATGAIGATTFTLASGTLPAGLTLATNGVLSGTPTQTGSFPITVTATDSNGCTGTSATYTIVIGCQVINVTNPATTTGTVSAAFSQTFTQTGAIGGATFTTASTLPAGLTLATNGTLSGTPTQSGSFPIVVTVTDGNGCTGTGATYTLVIGCQTITVTNPVNTNGTVSSAFSETFTQTSAVGGATFTTASTLPAGLTLATNGVLSGIPTQSGSFPIVVMVTDGNGCTGTGATYNLVIACQVITVTNPANATGPAGTPFSETFTQTGAIGAATFTTASTLPAGLTLSTAGVLSGTPTQGGTFPIVVTVTDSNGCTGTSATYNLIITCPVITVTNPGVTTGTAGTAFSQTFTQTGGQGTITFTTSSTLPTGLSLATNGTLSGTPTQTGSFPIVVTATDQNGCVGTGVTYTLVIGCQTITVTNPGVSTGVAAAPFSQTFTQSSAIGGATFTLNSGTLPTGLSLATNGTLSGTPTQTGSFPITVLVTDGNGCTGVSATYNLTITCQTITVTNPATTTGTIGSSFSQTFTQVGAIGSATFTLNTGTLPTGLSLATNGTLSGTPTQTGSFPITVKVTDGNGCTGISATYTLVINCQTITVTNPANSSATVGTGFSDTFAQTGALGGATFTLNTGVLPTGITLATNGTIAGTPTQAGSFPITVKVTDGNGCTGISPTYTLVVVCQVITVTNPGVTTGTVDAAFSQTFTQTGAVGTATFTINTGTLPSGLTLSTAGVLSGSPGQPGSFPITVKVTDSNGCTGISATYTLVIACQTITVTNPGVTAGTVDAVFSQTFTQSGVGTHTPATFTTSSTLPSGLTLSSAGVLSGTPGQPGSFPIVVTVTDVNGCTGTGATYTLVIACQTITVTNPGVTTATYNSAFTRNFTQTGVGTHTPATFTTSSTLPTGVTLSSAGVLAGTPTQTGTFPIVVTVTDANGCTGTGATYTLAVAPVAVANSFANAVDNTQLVLTGGTTLTPSTPSVQIAGSISTNDLPSGGVSVVTGTFATTAGGSVTVAADGTFVYTPPVNSAAPAITSDTFNYTVTSNTGGTGPVTSAPATVTINLVNRVWYVKNDSTAGGNGQSQAPFDTLVEAQTASTANDHIYVYFGNGTTSGQNAGIILKAGQRLLGQGVPLIVNTQTLVTSGSRPLLTSAGDTVAASSAMPAEIRGLNLSSTGGSGIDVTAAGAYSGSPTLSIGNISFGSTTAEAIDVNAGATGTLGLSIIVSNWVGGGTAGANAIDIRTTAGTLNLGLDTLTGVNSTATGIFVDGSGGGTLNITTFNQFSIDGNTGGGGVTVTSARFDQVVGGTFDVVNAGAISIGAVGNPVGTTGMVLTNVSGDLNFSGLQIFASNGAALRASSTVAYTGSAGLRIVGAGTDVYNSTGGPAVDLTTVTTTLTPTQIVSTNSTTQGVNLVSTTGSFTAGSSSTITNATGTDFFISTSSVDVTYAGTITDDQGQLITISSNTGTRLHAFTGAITDGDDGDGTGITISGNSATTTMRFSGGLVLSTGTAAAFSASGAGVLEVCDENPCNAAATGGNINKITTTTGTALNVNGVSIGAGNLEFRSISAGTGASGPTNGIVLNNTGSAGGLVVKGTGSNGSGGTIQRTTGVGILLTSTQHVSLSWMIVTLTQDDGIRGQTVNNFSLLNSNLTTCGNAVAENGLQFGEATGVVGGITGTLILTNVNITASAGNNVHIRNTSGVLSSMTITGGSFDDLNDVTGANSFLFEMSGTASTTTATLSGVGFDNNSPQRALEVQVHDDGTISDFFVTGNSQFTNNGIHASFTQDTTADMRFSVTNNNFQFADPLHAINVFSSSTSTGGTLRGTISGNTIGAAANAQSGAKGNAIRLFIQGRTVGTFLIDANVIRQVWLAGNAPRGMDLQFVGPTAGAQPITQSDITLTNNDVDTMAPAAHFPLAAMYLSADNQGSPARVRARIVGNNARNSVGGGSFDYPSFDGNGAHLIFAEVTAGAEGQLVDNAPASANALAEMQASNPATLSTRIYELSISLIAGPINLP